MAKTVGEITTEMADILRGQAVLDFNDALARAGGLQGHSEWDICADLDRKVFLCEGCGWWHDADELGDFIDQLCTDCFNV